jgi:hypothetical protein
MTLSVRPSFRFSFQNQIWEDCCNRPDASLPWSGRAYDRYENCVQQITRLNGHPLGPDERSLYKEITCSGNATVRTSVPHRPDVRASPSGRGSQTGKIFNEIFRISVAQLSVRMAYDHRPDGTQLYQARGSFEPSAYK